MDIFIIVMLFIYGASFGSFYGVVADRLSNGLSIVRPPSFCDECKKNLKWFELIPIFSFIFQRGRCRNCKKKLSLFYPFVEILTGFLFIVSYLVFGFSFNFLISILISSYFVIVLVSDIKYYIIPDEVTVFLALSLVILNFINYGFDMGISFILQGLILFLVMFIAAILGKLLFKKECLGGGDIKLTFVTGLFLNVYNGLFSIFVASILAFPISLFILFKDKNHMIPFGPFLICASLIIYLMGFDISSFLENLIV